MEPAIQESAFKAVCAALQYRKGEDNAITLDELAILAGLYAVEPDAAGVPVRKPRLRQIEHLMETRLADIPFLVVSTSRGYFRPAAPCEIEHCWRSLQSRIRGIAARMHTLRIKAPASGFRYYGNGRFTQFPLTDLFESNQ